MATRPRKNGSTEPPAVEAPGREERAEGALGNSAPEEEIRLRAYEIYCERGEQPGRELDDWLQAERELERGGLGREQAGHEGKALAAEKD